MHQEAEFKSLEKRFRSRLPLRLELATIERLVGFRRNEDRVMLDIGFPSPVMSAALRARGASWSTIARSPEDAHEFARLVGSPAYCLGADGTIPFETHNFDTVVIALDIIAAFGDSEFFLRECNRVLKNTGEIILSAQFRKTMSLVNIMRERIARRSGDSSETPPNIPIAHSLTETEIYRLMKPGFDVLGITYHCSFFSELARLWEAKLIAEGRTEEEIAPMMRWKFHLAQQLDFFTRWNRGYIATVRARRRRWRERITPVLTDGRTIQEAVFIPDDGVPEFKP